MTSFCVVVRGCRDFARGRCASAFVTILFCGLLLLPFTSATAQDTWVGGTGNWSNGSDWSTGFPPQSTDVVTIYSGGTDYVTLDVGSATVYSLALGGAPNGYTSELTDGGTPQILTVTNGLNVGQNGFLYFYGYYNTLNLGGNVSNSGILELDINSTVNSSGTFSNSGQLDSYGGILNNNGGTINNFGYFYNHDLSNNGSGTINNFGYIYSPGPINNVQGSTFNNYSTIDDYSTGNSGTINNLDGGTINIYSLINNTGTLNNYKGGALNILINYGGRLVNYNAGKINNYGTINNDFELLIANGVLDNIGTINNNILENSGTINNSGTIISQSFGLIENLNGGVLNNSGTLINPSQAWLDIYTGSTINNSGSLSNSGKFDNFYGVLNNSGTINNLSGGTLDNYFATVRNEGVLNNYGAITNSGTFIVASGATLTNYDTQGSGTYTQSAGSTVVDGLFSSSTTIQINGGTLSGSGTIQGDVAMGGTMSPGDSPGKLTINGNYTQLATGTLFAELAGLTPGTQYDQLVISGMATLDGTLDVALLNGFMVQIGDQFYLMTFASETGQFATLELPVLPSGEMWVLFYDATDVRLEAEPTPEPASLVLLGTGLMGMAGFVRRSMKR